MRKLQQIIAAQPVSDGDGVSIFRLGGRRLQSILDPYLMIDEINSDNADDYIGGFPEHPHRGFETITYMKAGRMRHRDHMGNVGLVGAGDVQWMTAGRGVLHSEMPEQEQGLLHGFQIWLNLSAEEKMKPAAYRDIRHHDIPQQTLPLGGTVKAIAGKVTVNSHSLTGALPAMTTEPVLLDVTLKPNEVAELNFANKHQAVVYVYQGHTDQLQSRQLGVYAAGDSLRLKAGDEGATLLVLSGKALKQPIAQYGPFVMNSREQIEQAIEDYQQGRLAS